MRMLVALLRLPLSIRANAAGEAAPPLAELKN